MEAIKEQEENKTAAILESKQAYQRGEIEEEEEEEEGEGEEEEDHTHGWRRSRSEDLSRRRKLDRRERREERGRMGKKTEKGRNPSSDSAFTLTVRFCPPKRQTVLGALV
jgi:hypothetical protein